MPDLDSTGATPSSDDSMSSGRGKKAMKAAGRSLMASGQSEISDSGREAASSIHAVSYKRGGKIRKTGVKNLHRGERVIPKSKVARVDKMMRKAKMRKRSQRG